MAHLRITLRQPIGVLGGKKMIALNDAVEVVEAGEVLADLSGYVRRIELVDDVGSPRIVRLELFAGEVQSETELERHTVRLEPQPQKEDAS